MAGQRSSSGRIKKLVAVALLGVTLVSLISPSAEAARFRGRRWGRAWGGYRAYRVPYRYPVGVFPRAGYGYGAGYRGYGYRAYGPNFLYGAGLPYDLGYGSFYAPMNRSPGFYNYVPPMM
jgi:hypothetical protein